MHDADSLTAEAYDLAQGRDPGDVQFDEESGEGDTLAVERERDLALSAQARQQSRRSTRRCEVRRRHLRHLRAAPAAIPKERLEGDPVGP